MTEPVELALPCRLVSLQLQLAPEESLSGLENLVTRAILLGRDTMDDLADLFSLSPRIVSDVVTTMWEKGFIVVEDDENQRLDVSDAARASLTRTGEVVSERRIMSREFVFEPLTRRVLGHNDPSVVRWAAVDSVSVPSDAGVSAEDVPEEDLIRAVQKELDRSRVMGNRDHVLRVGFGNRLLRPPDRLRWLHVRVRIGHDARSHRYLVTVDDDRWEEGAREQLGSALESLLEQAPDSRFAKQLRERAVEHSSEPETIESLFAELRGALGTVHPEDADGWEDAHRDVVALTERIDGRLAELRRDQVEAMIVANEAAVDWAVSQLVTQSRKQLILVVPDIVYGRLNPWLDSLRAALNRKVRLYVLWGRGDDESLSEAVVTALRRDLGHEFPGQVTIAQQSCRTEACLLVQDDERVLVTSHSLFGDVRENNRLGCLIEAPPAAECPARAVADLLLWCRRTFPDPRTQRQILVHEQDFGRPPPAAHGHKRIAGDLPKALDPGTNAAGVASYRAGVQRVLLALSEDFKEVMVGTAARAVTDGELRPLYWDLLRSAVWRFVVVDDRIDFRVADPSMAQAVRDCHARADVQLVHPRPSHLKSEEPFGRLGQGRDAVPVRSEHARARVVIADNATLIGSFSPLADGEGRFRRMGERLSQVGVLIDSVELSTEMAGQLSAVPNARPPEPLPIEAIPPEALDLDLLKQVGRTTDGYQIAELIRSRPPEGGDYWAMLDGWEQLGVPVPQLRAAVAAVLRLPALHLGGDDAVAAEARHRARWVGWLIRDAWHRRAFVEAALLAPLDGTRSPLAVTATLAAALEIGPLGSLGSESAIELWLSGLETGLDTGLAVVATAGRIAECLIWSDPDGAEAAETFKSWLPPAWLAFAKAVADHYDPQEGGVPRHTMMYEQSRRSLLAGLEKEREEILHNIQRLKEVRHRFTFPAGRVLYRNLLGPGGLLTVLGETAGAGLRAVAELEADLPQDVQGFLDRIIDVARNSDRGIDEMIWSSQLGFLRTVEAVISSGRRIREQWAAAQAPPVSGLPAGLAAIAGHLEEHWKELFTEADALGSPFQEGPLHLLDWLELMAEWARGTR